MFVCVCGLVHMCAGAQDTHLFRRPEALGWNYRGCDSPNMGARPKNKLLQEQTALLTAQPLL